MATLDPSRRTALNAVKLRALVTGAFGAFEATSAASLGAGAAMADDRRAFVLPDDHVERAVGPAMAWGEARGVHEVHLLVEEHAGALARRAALFTEPLSVWQIDGRSLAPAGPDPVAPVGAPTPEASALGLVLEQAGLDVVVEHGSIIGEVLGLEVARVVVDESGAARVEVGVGKHDREAFGIVHGDLPTADALASVLDTVRSQRRADLPQHPLNLLAPERWLLQQVLRDPARFGSWPVARESGTILRRSVKDVLPALAAGTDPEGRPVVLAASVGVDLDLLPAAGDARAAIDPTARLIVVVPERDAVPVTRRLAARLRPAAELVTVAGDWRVPDANTLGAHDRPAG